jgi:predicted Rossmann fold nucleotide-binding protein DprA/Smf involved in DNA uptake
MLSIVLIVISAERSGALQTAAPALRCRRVVAVVVASLRVVEGTSTDGRARVGREGKVRKGKRMNAGEGWARTK